ncbi:SDR family oxidoreductase [Bacillus sp. 1P06AnD]|uniref:SDR family oxidoreductase n=1 Tax=Bacillus sp. 1P06AnD TaxID=3132208 RepID=UPI0039A08862
MRIFLTGATGFLGMKIAGQLVNEGHEVLLFVRNKVKAQQIVQSIDKDKRSSLYIVEGELTKPSLGLNEETINQWKGRVDCMVHSAALLSFNPLDDEKVYKVNVIGTEHALQAAEQIGCKSFIYVSTAYTVGMDNEGHELLYSMDRKFCNSYERTKCIAEYLVMSYSTSMSIQIVRPSIIIGDSKTGEAQTSFGLYGILRSLRILKRRMERKPQTDVSPFRLLLDGQSASNIVPVDYVAKVAMAACLYGENRGIYHATNPNPPLQKDVFELVKEHLQMPELELVDYQQKDLLRADELSFNEPLAVFKPYLSRTVNFQCPETEQLLKKQNLKLLHMDEKMLKRIINGFN